MSFILSWSGYFSRKGWDPKRWATANGVVTYEDCVKRTGKMQVRPPSREQFNLYFIDQLSSEDLEVSSSSNQVKVADLAVPEVVYVKPLKKEQEKELPKRRPRKRTTKKAGSPEKSETGSGTTSIIDSVKKKTTTKRTRSRKNVKST